MDVQKHIAVFNSRVHADKLRLALWNEFGYIDSEITTKHIKDTQFEYIVYFSPAQKLKKRDKLAALDFASGFKAGIKYL